VIWKIRRIWKTGKDLPVLSSKAVPVSSRERIDVRVSAVDIRVLHNQAVLLDPFIRNTKNVTCHASLVSSEILAPSRSRSVDQPVDHAEKVPCTLSCPSLPPLIGHFSSPGVFFGSHGQYLYGVGKQAKFFLQFEDDQPKKKRKPPTINITFIEGSNL